jgi:hypothetical protein
MHVVHIFLGKTTGKTRTAKDNLVAHLRYAGEDLMQMNLRPSCQRVLDVLPIRDEDAHEHRGSEVNNLRSKIYREELSTPTVTEELQQGRRVPRRD